MRWLELERPLPAIERAAVVALVEVSHSQFESLVRGARIDLQILLEALPGALGKAQLTIQPRHHRQRLGRGFLLRDEALELEQRALVLAALQLVPGEREELVAVEILRVGCHGRIAPLKGFRSGNSGQAR